MSAKRVLITLIALAALCALVIPASLAAAQAPPSLPCRFYGTVILDGSPVPDGTVITAAVSGDTYATTTPALVGGQPRYGNSTFALTLEPLPGSSYNEGAEVVFTVAGYEVEQRGYWETGGNVPLDLVTWRPIVQPTPGPTPTMSPTPTTTPAPTPTLTPPPPTPIPTVPPPPIQQGQDAAAATNAMNTAIVALCIGILIVCLMFAAYLIWKYRVRPGPSRGAGPRAIAPQMAPMAADGPVNGLSTATTPEGNIDTTGLDALAAIGASPRWQDRLMLKMMSNGIVIKIFSNPTVLKVITWEMKVFGAIASRLKRGTSKGDGMQQGGSEQTAASVQAGGEAVAGAEAPNAAADTGGLDALAALGASMRWQDRLMIKAMSNTTVLKIFSNPVVMKVITWEMKAIMGVASLFKRK